MNEALEELRESARQVLSQQPLAESEAQTWPLVRELGWLLVALDESDGGLGQGWAGACAFQQELGRRLNAAPYLPAMLVIEAVRHSQFTDRAKWLAKLTAGERVTAPLADARISISAQRVMEGTLIAVPSADAASHVLIRATDCVALLPVQQAGVRVEHRPTWDGTRRLFDVDLSGVTLDPELVLSRGEEAQLLIRRLGTQRDFALAADAVGGAAALLDMTVDYLQTRRQFGRPLAMFQALKHRCADLKAAVSAAEALLADALTRVGEDDSTLAADTLGRGAKSHACAVYARVAEEALQLHGGIGMTAEHGCHLYLKRALLNAQLGRAREAYETVIADRLLSSEIAAVT